MDTKTNETEENVSSSKNKLPVFKSGQKVVALFKHTCYLVTIIHVNPALKQCIVEFKNSTLRKISFDDLTAIKLPKKAQECVVCKSAWKSIDGKVSTCYKCGRGFHMNCHSPPLSTECYFEGKVWNCKQCLDNEIFNPEKKISEEKVLQKESRKKIHTYENKKKRKRENSKDIVNLAKLKLPYNLELLHWDSTHTTNKENLYCYCCQSHVPYQMLQCERCKQWFHGKCIRSLKFPLLKGDRFYVFICSICNYGKEFLYRIKLTWLDLVHLTLFNILVINSHKFFDLYKIILFFLDCNWPIMQLPPEINKLTRKNRCVQFLSVLKENKDIFINGEEENKGTHLWGLRSSQPPSPPNIIIPEKGLVTQEMVENLFHFSKNVVIEVEDEEYDVEVNIEDNENESDINNDIVDDIEFNKEVIKTNNSTTDNPEKISSEIDQEPLSENTSNALLFLSNKPLKNNSKHLLKLIKNKRLTVENNNPHSSEKTTPLEVTQLPIISSIFNSSLFLGDSTTKNNLIINNVENVFNETNNKTSDEDVIEMPTSSVNDNDVQNNPEKLINKTNKTTLLFDTTLLLNNSDTNKKIDNNIKTVLSDNRNTNLNNLKDVQMPASSSTSDDAPLFLFNSDMNNIPIINNIDLIKETNNDNSQNKSADLLNTRFRMDIPLNVIAPNMFATVAIPYTIAVLNPNVNDVNEKKMFEKQKKKRKKGESLMRLIKIT